MMSPLASPPKQQTLSLKQAIELALQHHRAGHLPQAEGIYRQVLQADPKNPTALHFLGLLGIQLGKTENGIELIEQALAVQPNYTEAYNNLGIAYKKIGNYEKAVACYQKVLSNQPDFPEAHNNFANALLELGKSEEAIGYFHRAFFLAPENEHYRDNFAHAVSQITFSGADDALLDSLARLLMNANVRPSELVRPSISALECNPSFAQTLQDVRAKQDLAQEEYSDHAERLSSYPLFLHLLSLTPINRLEIERALTVLRKGLLWSVRDRQSLQRGIGFSQALALQCFTNEYVFSETEEESRYVEELSEKVSAYLDRQETPPADWIIALGCYKPLYRFPWAKTLTERTFDCDVQDLLNRQVTEPLKEQSLRAGIPQLTPIQGDVSVMVREQYEENPYPRWIKTACVKDPKDIVSALKDSDVTLEDYTPPQHPEILVAGCGTGQHSLGTATRFAGANVLAIDLSLASLSYAKRKTEELGVSNIAFAQADIMELGVLDKRFDVIESSGVLHHIADPAAAWRVLVGLLRPSGLMKVGLYSALARRDIVKARDHIAQQGYGSTPNDIRQCRQDIVQMAAGGNAEMELLSAAKDFYSLSDCRDLIFHVQEHRFTLEQIAALLDDLGLQFLGFELTDAETKRTFQQRHPAPSDWTSLPLWHQFEQDHPNAFRGMYQFWFQKR